MLDDIARQDGVAVMPDGLIELDGLRQLSRARQRNLIRHVLRERGLTPPSEAQLVAGLGQLLSARVDRQPLMNWPGGQIRRYRERLYVLAGDPERATAGLPDDYEWDGCAPLDLGPVRGRLQLISDDPTVRVPAALKVRFRRGGERLPAADRRHHQRLKKVFQAQGIVPWMRAHVPLVIYDGELLAVADLWSSGAMAEWRDGSCRLVWDRHAVVR
ncbi:MAG: tRNA lysidine(34) synthetase TilS [Gammaproteobacteria bacterium]